MENNNQNVEEIICPKCKVGTMKTKDKFWYCSNWNVEPKCNFSIWKTIAGATLIDTDIKEILLNGKAGPFKFMSKKTDKPYEAFLEIIDGELKFKFPEKAKQ